MSKSTSPPTDSKDETKKRTRVTPAQLAILEETFSMTTTPESKLRKQLAERLEMPERSIQIWFQNRRAKVKLLQKRVQQENRTSPYWYPKQKVSMRAWSSEIQSMSHTPPPFVPPPNHMFPFHHRDSSSLSLTGSSAYYTPSPQPSLFKGPENDDLNVGHITASSLTIGTWHRMKISQLDLQCSFSIIDRQFSWHIRDSTYHFKMIVSFDAISSIQLHVLQDDLSAQINIHLINVPVFFMESNHQWIQCSDFTEGMQASCVLNHVIRGSAIDLQQQLLAITGVDERLFQVTRFSAMSFP